jgi:hypothetical protein
MRGPWLGEARNTVIGLRSADGQFFAVGAELKRD